MTLFRVTKDKFESVRTTRFEDENIFERQDLQRFLFQDISPLGNDLLVLAEEYGQWEDSRRRIDLLCLTRAAGLAVVELKRTQDGGHMELQAIRYAAMVSSMTLDQAVETYAETRSLAPDRARSEVLDFLKVESIENTELSGEVRIILVSADFSTEVTTAVLWLNKHDLDITCIRLRPYRSNDQLLLDIAQIIPLPEAADYEVKLRAQQQERRKVESTNQELKRRFWATFIERSKATTKLFAGCSPTQAYWITGQSGYPGFNLQATLNDSANTVDLEIRLAGGRDKNTVAFDALLNQRDPIERAFGAPLEWQRLEGRVSCRIRSEAPGGWLSPDSEWPAVQQMMIDKAIRLHAALKEPLRNLKL